MIALLARRVFLRIGTDPTIVLHFGKNGGRRNGQIGPISLHDHMLFSCPIIDRKGPINQQAVGICSSYAMNRSTKRLTIRPRNAVLIDLFGGYHTDGAAISEKILELGGKCLPFLGAQFLGIPYRKKDRAVFVGPFRQGRKTNGPCCQWPPERSSSGLIDPNLGPFIILKAHS